MLEHHGNYSSSQLRALCLVCCSVKEPDVVWYLILLHTWYMYATLFMSHLGYCGLWSGFVLLWCISKSVNPLSDKRAKIYIKIHKTGRELLHQNEMCSLLCQSSSGCWISCWKISAQNKSREYSHTELSHTIIVHILQHECNNAFECVWTGLNRVKLCTSCIIRGICFRHYIPQEFTCTESRWWWYRF